MERGESTLMVIIVIGTAVVLMFVIPMIQLANGNNQVVQATIQTKVTDFVLDAAAKGKITDEEYEKLLLELNSTGVPVELDIVIKVLDENTSIKVIQATNDKLGENKYVLRYKTQFEEDLFADGVYIFNEGDILSMKAKNAGPTMFDSLLNAIFTSFGNDTYLLVGEETAMATANGE